MPHRSHAPPRAPQGRAIRQAIGTLAGALSLAAAPLRGASDGNRQGNDRAAVLDSTQPRRIEEGHAAPSRPFPIPPGPRGDSVRQWLAVRDSGLALDSAFQRVRADANRQALALSPTASAAERRSPEYARRFDAWRALSVQAESLRTARDRYRARAQRMGDRLDVE